MDDATRVEMPVRVIWRFSAPPGRPGRVDQEWLAERLEDVDKSGATVGPEVSRARPLYPFGLVDGLERRYGERGERATGCLSRISRTGTKVVNGRAALGYLEELLRELEVVETGSVDSILDTSVASVPQPYLDHHEAGGICLDRDDDSLRGEGVTLAVVEMGYDAKHPDLPGTQIQELPLPGPPLSAPGEHETRHGNQILGVLCARRDQQGIDGVVDRSDKIHVARFGDDGTADSPADTHVFTAVGTAVNALPPGSVLVAAVDARKPWYTNRLPLEAWKEARDLFHLAAENPTYVVTAAGNGLGVPIDPFCEGDQAPSPAFVVGAAALEADQPAWMSNVGERVDLHSWGTGVATCDLEGVSQHFGGTSSATTIVAAAVAAVVSRVRHLAKNGSCPLPTPDQLRRLLVTTGYRPIHQLGPRPDVAAAVELLAEIGCKYGKLPP